jgi:hypothetical protein
MSIISKQKKKKKHYFKIATKTVKFTDYHKYILIMGVGEIRVGEITMTLRAIK